MPESLKNLKDLVAINVMFSPGGRSPADIRKTLSSPGVVDFEQTFPFEEDDELNRLYVLRVKSEKVPQVLSRLRRSAVVEFAESAAKHRLIR